MCYCQNLQHEVQLLVKDQIEESLPQKITCNFKRLLTEARRLYQYIRDVFKQHIDTWLQDLYYFVTSV